MDYKQKYEEALEKARVWKEKSGMPVDRQGILDDIFPELKESDDEMIRKALLNEFIHLQSKGYKFAGLEGEEIVTWLEKQGEKIDAIENLDTEFEKQVSHLIASAINKEHEYNQSYVKWTANALLNYAKHELEKQGEQSIYDVPSRNMILAVWELGNEWKELTNGSISKEYGTQLEYIQKHWNESPYYLRDKQGEQKPADKVEPKFKIGDWIVSNRTNKTYKIDSINTKDANYIIYSCVPSVYTNEDSPCFSESMIHLWTIQDAKDGDVLYTSSTASNEVFIFKGLSKEGHIECYCSYDSEDKYCDGKYHFIGKPTFMTHPATKEKRELLFQKMKEAGYEWDAEKKELKKIKQDDNTYTIVEKEEKKVTYNDIARKLFSNNFHTFYINNDGDILDYRCVSMYNRLNNCISKKQAEKLLAINMLMNVAKHLNGDWQPDWKNRNENKIFIYIDYIDKSIKFGRSGVHQSSEIYFKSEELAQKAIEILGEETIKLTLCTDY